MQNLDEILLRQHCKDKASTVTYFLPHKTNKKNPKYKRIHIKKVQKIAQIDGERPKWQVKSWMTRMYKIGKIKDPILIDERPIRRKFCIWGKEIQI